MGRSKLAVASVAALVGSTFALIVATETAAGAQTFTSPSSTPYVVDVPGGVTSVTITAVGARGGNSGGQAAQGQGGGGATVTATVTVQPCTQLAVFVGFAGNDAPTGDAGLGISGGGGDGSGVGVLTSSTTGKALVAAGGGGGGGAGGLEGSNGGDAGVGLPYLVAAGGTPPAGHPFAPDGGSGVAGADGVDGADGVTRGRGGGLTGGSGGTGSTVASNGQPGTTLPTAPPFVDGGAGGFEPGANAGGAGGGGFVAGGGGGGGQKTTLSAFAASGGGGASFVTTGATGVSFSNGGTGDGSVTLAFVGGSGPCGKHHEHDDDPDHEAPPVAVATPVAASPSFTG